MRHTVPVHIMLLKDDSWNKGIKIYGRYWTVSFHYDNKLSASPGAASMLWFSWLSEKIMDCWTAIVC